VRAEAYEGVRADVYGACERNRARAGERDSARAGERWHVEVVVRREKRKKRKNHIPSLLVRMCRCLEGEEMHPEGGTAPGRRGRMEEWWCVVVALREGARGRGDLPIARGNGLYYYCSI
jgi:hypothetical protein